MNKQDMVNQINKLKIEKNVVILAHLYQIPEIQDIADYIGDSLYLSKVASETNADIIIFCGVHFMAETAKILSPDKKVLLPVKEAGCPMADMIDDIKLLNYKKNNPESFIICYVNSSAKVKALSDICVTSSNAEKIILDNKDKKILYIPDQNLGEYFQKKHNLSFDTWPGYCCVHSFLTKEMVLEAKKKHPNAKFIAHPEAKIEILDIADYVGSTSQLIEFTKISNSNEFIIGTEEGVIYQMKKHNPNKKFYILTPDLKCYDMKLTTLTDLYNSISNFTYEIKLDDAVIKKAFKSLNRMLLHDK